MFNKRSIPTLTILFAGLLVISCKKKDLQYTFKGNVIETVNGTPLSGAEVSLYQVQFDASAANSNFQFAAKSTTDGSGNYEIIVDREKVIDFKVNFKKSGYFQEEYIIGSDNVSVEEPYVINHQMDAVAYFVIDIKNNSPLADDVLTLVKYNFREGCNACTENNYAYFEGAVDTTLIYQTTAGVYTRFAYKDESTGMVTNDSLYTIPFDTVFYSIVY